MLSEYWKDRHEIRQKELDFALRANESLPFVSKIILFCSDGARIEGPKFEHIDLPERPTYFRIFQEANKYNDTCVVMNTDMHLLPESEERIGRFDLNTSSLCLARWDKREDGRLELFRTGGSYDTYIFKAPMPIEEKFSNHTPGIPGCDAKLCFAMNRVRKAINPANTVVTVHVHMSGLRSYDGNARIHGNYHVVPIS